MLRACNVCSRRLKRGEKTYCRGCRAVLNNIANVFGKGKMYMPRARGEDPRHEARIYAHRERVEREMAAMLSSQTGMQALIADGIDQAFARAAKITPAKCD